MKFKITFILILGCVTAFAQKQVTFFEPEIEVSADPSSFVKFNDKLLYLAQDKFYKSSIWITDGTKNGTSKFLENDSNLGFYNPVVSVKNGENLYIFNNFSVLIISPDFKVKRIQFDVSDLEYYNLKSFDNKIILGKYYFDVNNNSLNKFNFPASTINSNWFLIPNLISKNSVLHRSFAYRDDYYIVLNNVNASKIRRIKFPNFIPEYSFRKLIELNNKEFLILDEPKTGSTYFGELGQEDFIFIDTETFKNKSILSIKTESGLSEFILLDNFTNSIFKVITDGNNFNTSLIKSNPFLIGNFIAFEETTDFIYGYDNTQKGKTINIVKFNKNTKELTNILNIKSDIEVYNFKLINDEIYVLGREKIGTEYLSRNNTWLVDETNKQLIKKNYNDPIVLDNKVIGVASVINNNPINYELHEVSKDPLLIYDSGEKEYTDFNFFGNNKSKSVYLAKYSDGNYVYHLDQKSNIVKSIYEDKNIDKTKIWPYNNLYFSSMGYQINEKNSFIKSHSNFSSDLLINEETKKVEKINPAISQDYRNFSDTFEIPDFKNPSTPFKLKFPVKVRLNRLPNFNYSNLIFGTDSLGRTGKELFSYSTKTGIKLLFKEDYKLFNLNEQYLVLTKKGNLHLVNNFDNPEIYLLTNSIELWDNSIEITKLATGFLITNSKKIWYFDGNCKNSKIIYEFSENENLIGGIQIMKDNNFFFASSKGKKTFYYDGLKLNELGFEISDNSTSRYLGYLKSRVYFLKTDSKLESNISKYSFTLYSFDLENAKLTKIRETTDGNYYSNYIRDISNTDTKILAFGGKIYFLDINDQITETLIEGNIHPISKNGNDLFYIYHLEAGRDSYQYFYHYKNGIVTKNSEAIDTFISSDKFNYLFHGNLVTRINISNGDLKKITLPGSISSISYGYRFPTDYSIDAVGSKLYAKINTSKTGLQLWELDDAEQNFQVTPEPTYFYKGNQECRQTTEPRLVSQISPYLEILATEVPKSNISIYPNPVSNSINVVLPQEFNIQKTQSMIINANGSILSSDLILNPIGDKVNSFSISLPQLSPGVYQLIFVDNKQKKYNFKFIKQ